MQSEVAWGWAAGLFEGEGSIVRCSPTPKDRHGRRMLSLQMTDRDVVERFAVIVQAGNPRPARRNFREQRKPMFSWQTSRRQDVERILQRMLPFFGERRALAAAEALEWLEQRRQENGGSLDYGGKSQCKSQPSSATSPVPNVEAATP